VKNFFLAVGIITGTIIGAGIFSLPYVFKELGILTGFLYLIVFALIYYLIHRRYAEILRSDDWEEHHFSYFAKKHLSRFWGKVASGLVIFELIFTLTIYLILSKSFADLISGGTGVWVVFVFWILSSVLIFSRSSLTGWSELLGGLGIILIALFILMAGGQGGEIELPTTKPINLFLFFLPFGPLLFSFSGRAAVSKVVTFYKACPPEKKFPLKKAIFWGTILPIFIYSIFITGVLQITPDVSPDTLGSLTGLPQNILLLIGITGLLTLWTSYFVLGGNLYDILRFDVLKKNIPAGLIAVLAPVAFYLLGFKNFIATVSIAGGFLLAFEAIFINIIWVKVKGLKRFFWTIFLCLIFVTSILYQLLKVFGVWD
jgi:amino acid permease